MTIFRIMKKYFIKLHNGHYDPTPFLKCLVFVGKKLIQLIFEVIICGCGLTVQKKKIVVIGIINNPRAPDLENVVGIAIYPI